MLSSNIVVECSFAEEPISCIFYVGTAFKGQTLSYSHMEHIAFKVKSQRINDIQCSEQKCSNLIPDLQILFRPVTEFSDCSDRPCW